MVRKSFIKKNIKNKNKTFQVIVFQTLVLKKISVLGKTYSSILIKRSLLLILEFVADNVLLWRSFKFDVSPHLWVTVTSLLALRTNS